MARMLKSCTRKYTDESDEGMFRFTFYCDRCGSSHQIKPVSFSGHKLPDSAAEKNLWLLRWQKGHTQAFERADYEAKYHFFCCPGCGEYVCQDCVVSERTPSGDIRDLCLDCNRRIAKKRNHPNWIIPPVEPRQQVKRKQKGCSLWKKIKGCRQSPEE
jgi:hypothetical protein